jgi:hypothetical protein
MIIYGFTQANAISTVNNTKSLECSIGKHSNSNNSWFLNAEYGGIIV